MIVDKNYKYKKELDLLQKTLKEAYKKCILNQHKDVKIKADKSLVTNIDVNTEKYIISCIKEQFPGDNFLTEETSSKTDLKNRTWIIDPIDGTSFFIRNALFYSIQVAFYDEGKTQLSVIYQPKLNNSMYVAVLGHGAYLNGKCLKRKCDVKLTSSFYCINSCPSRWTEKIRNINEKLYEYEKQCYVSPKQFKIDSSGVVYTLLANGTIDFLIEPARTKWDYMPGDLLVKEVGAKYYNFDNEDFERFYSFSPELDEYLGLAKKDK